MSTDDPPPVTRADLEAIHGDQQAEFLSTRKRDFGRFRIDDIIFDNVVRIANKPRLLVSATILVLVGAGLVYALIEDKGPIEGVWWAIVTGFTVGYGDLYPSSTAGRGVGAFLIISMFVLALCLGAQITSRLVEDADEFSHEEQEEMKAMLRHAAAERDLILSMLADIGDRMVARPAPCEACGHVSAGADRSTPSDRRWSPRA